MANFDKAIKATLENEGALSNNSNDSGGLTKFGISHKSYPNENIENLTIDRAKQIYFDDYWLPIKADILLSQQIAESMFDFAVNAGVKTSIKLAQRVVGVNDDGIIGKETIYALNTYSNELFLAKFTLAKIKRYIEICENNPNQKTFFFGWIRRTVK